MISKELLSEVLNLNMWKTNSLNILVDENKVSYSGIFLGDLGYQKSSVDINIYELSHKCKEWAFNKGYELFSRILSNDHQPVGNCVVYRVEADPEESLCITNADTEPEAIFKATSYIMEQLKQKD